jgi:hypothetical protein
VHGGEYLRKSEPELYLIILKSHTLTHSLVFGIKRASKQEEESAMQEAVKPTHTQPGAFQEKNPKSDDGVVNDSFGTVDPADSTGLDESKETGDAKRQNKIPTKRKPRPIEPGFLRFRRFCLGFRRALHFLQTGSLAAQSADVEQLRTADLIAADLLDLVDDLRIEGEDTLYALSKAHFADGKGALGPLVDGNYEAFKRLQTFLIAFFNLHLHANLVAGHEIGEIGALQLFSQTLHNWMD